MLSHSGDFIVSVCVGGDLLTEAHCLRFDRGTYMLVVYCQFVRDGLKPVLIPFDPWFFQSLL